MDETRVQMNVWLPAFERDELHRQAQAASVSVATLVRMRCGFLGEDPAESQALESRIARLEELAGL